MKQRTLALAGVFQAAELVRQAATHGTWSGYAASTCLRSLFAIDSDSVQDIYGGLERMRLGTEVLISILLGEKQYIECLHYSVGIMQIERKFRRQGSLQDRIGNELKRIARTHAELEPHEREDLQVQEVAELYSETISLISPRIVVQGNPQYLQRDRNVHWIRALLFSALRSAVLWDQLGGGRWNLMFGRKQMLREAEALLPG